MLKVFLCYFSILKMDWVKFFSGLAMFSVAYLWRRLSIWAYGKDGEENDYYSVMRKRVDWVGIILCMLSGLIVIFVSFAPIDK